MSQYTTGEIARLCGVTVRTVQYYDTREILVPSELTEGGRRLYTEEDVKRLKVICFLRELGVSINVISQLLKEEEPGSVIEVLLQQQSQVLREEIAQRQRQLKGLTELQQGIRTMDDFSIESIGDVAHLMENKKKLHRLYTKMLAVAIPLELLEAAAIVLWIVKGVWWPFLVWMLVAFPWIFWWVFKVYYKKVAYICPQCHSTFRPGKKEFFWASHTLKTRKLTCSCCGRKGFCVETWGGDLP